MKPFAVILLILCIAALAGMIWLFSSSSFEVVSVDCQALDASYRPDLFEQLKKQADQDRLIGTVFSEEPLGDVSDYQFLTYRVLLKNNTLLPARAVEVQVSPIPGDALQFGTLLISDMLYQEEPSEHQIRPLGTEEISVTVLSKKEAHHVRSVSVTGYFWGNPVHIEKNSAAR